MCIDLHIHTTFSDGLLTPEQVVNKAIKLNLKAIAITDHDTVDGIRPALNKAKNYTEFEIVPGVELSTDWNSEEVHILGYYIDYNDSNLKTVLLSFQQKRMKRVDKIIARLKNMGIDISIEDVCAKSKGSSLGRPHIALVLVEKGYVCSVQEAFKDYLSKGKPAYVPKEKLTPFSAIDIIKQSSGIPVLAHPGLLEDDSIINELISYGIMGIEVIHKNHNKAQVDYYTRLALDNNLLLTGGSDSHGETPLLLGSFDVPLNYFYKLKAIKKFLQYE
ncbi:PHP domain protein [Tepidanaerobacter acetatoxydans Re1]|uniref:PHP domain protein n=1 Tax=Tepidanaerobacter acetatoxydans (strain DSM 21804 / JCM 16047 / Re1) TaxID=1209989 RepID=F4LUB5_TEPAE|nr:PHP domain-containing protein [Tepidanaerobacter acetatoxydans]AEE91445.1 PHP domain protein [Tepidanaerobacter acetatoxydans Re1]CDI40678.1 PHP domain protein [Tepidanaerobacter acetatoxydans Re1]